MKKFKLLFLLFTVASYAIATTPRLDAVEANNAKLTSKLEESQRTLMQQELNNKSLESKINELKSELEKLKNTQDDYRIEKSSYDSKIERITDSVASEDKLLNYIIIFLGLLGLGTYFKAKHDAKETAQEFIEQWIENKATPHLNSKITEVLKTKDEEINSLIEGQIENRVEPLIASVKASLKDVEAHIDKAKTHVDEISRLSKIAKDTFKDIPKEELEKIEAKESGSLTSDEYYALGISAINDAKFNTALDKFENAIKLADENSPKLADLYFAKGFVLNELQAHDLAIDAYQKAVEINPKKDEAYYNMGIAYYHLGAFDEVIKAYQQALTINPNKSGAYTNLFELQLTQNQPFDQILEEEYIKRFKEQKKHFIHYEMLKVFQNIVNEKPSNLEQWQERYRGVSMGGWSFDELRTWIEAMEESEVKDRLVEALGVFEGRE